MDANSCDDCGQALSSEMVCMGCDERPLELIGYDNESVVVTHIDNPEKFYSRFTSSEPDFDDLNHMIWNQVKSPFAERPAMGSILRDDCLLAFSSIHQTWCRCRVVEHVVVGRDHMDGANGGDNVNVRVHLIDYGGVEVVGHQDLRLTTDEIVDANLRQGFCFECRLCYVKPFSDSNQWSSYGNYLFKKLSKEKTIVLKLDELCDGVVVCDLLCFDRGCMSSGTSMIEYLVHTRVARYRLGHDFRHRLFPDDGPDYDHKSAEPTDDWDEDFNAIDFHNNNKLYF